METHTKGKNKWMRGGTLAARKAFTEERDGMMISAVNTYRVVTAELVCAILGLDRTPSNLAIVDRRMRALAMTTEKRVSNFRQIEQDGVRYFVSLTVSMRVTGGRAQLLHRYMQSLFWSVLDLTGIPLEPKITDTELRAQKLSLSPDGFFAIGSNAYFLETHTGREAFDHPMKKVQEYQRQQKYLCEIFLVTSFRVLWLNHSQQRMAQMIKSFPQSGMFLVAHESAVDPFKPESILSCWTSLKDGSTQSLMEDKA